MLFIFDPRSLTGPRIIRKTGHKQQRTFSRKQPRSEIKAFYGTRRGQNTIPTNTVQIRKQRLNRTRVSLRVERYCVGKHKRVQRCVGRPKRIRVNAKIDKILAPITFLSFPNSPPMDGLAHGLSPPLRTKGNPAIWTSTKSASAATN